MATYSKEGEALKITETVERKVPYARLIQEKKMLEQQITTLQARLAASEAVIKEAEKLGLK